MDRKRNEMHYCALIMTLTKFSENLTMKSTFTNLTGYFLTIPNKNLSKSFIILLKY